MTPRSGNGSARDKRDIALLGALSLFLSALDYLIPKPLPFMRLGLANLPILLALAIAPFADYCLLIAVKVLGQALITGSLFSYIALFSLMGSLSSAMCMFLLYRALGRGGPFGISLAGTGAAGAFVSNAVQLALARFFVFGKSALYLAPLFLASGIISGTALGIFAEVFAARSVWFSLRRAEHASITGENLKFRATARNFAARSFKSTENTVKRFSGTGTARLCAGFALALFFTLVPRLEIKAALFAVFWITAIVRGRKINPVITLAVMTGIVVCNLFPPCGKVLAGYGPVIVTQGSLEGGIRKALSFEGLVMLSKLVLRNPHNSLPSNYGYPGSFGRLLGETFSILEQLNRHKAAFSKSSRKTLVKKLDELLLVLGRVPTNDKENEPPRPKGRGIA